MCSISKTKTISLQGVHHIAIIASNYSLSKEFYTQILGCTVLTETFRKERNSFKLDLLIPNSTVQIELFSFPNPPPRPWRPEAVGLRHLAFKVKDLKAYVNYLQEKGVQCEPIRLDELTGCYFTFFADPDDLPLEIYEQI